MLTLSQKKTLNFITDFINRHDYAPTAAEIAAGIGIKSRGVVHRYLRVLESTGFIKLTPKRHRNIHLLDRNQTLPSILPLVGEIAAGQPIEAIAQHEAIDVMNIFLGENRFALRVKGDSMIDEGIYDEDIIVCEQTDLAENGQIVVALIDGQEATLKRLQRNLNETITLHPANQGLKPMTYPAERIQIQGLYVGLLRF